MRTPKRSAAHGEVADIALEALALARGQRRPPSKQDVTDALHMSLVSHPCGQRKQAMLIRYGWGLTLRMWWRERCVPDWAAGLEVGPTPTVVQDDLGSGEDAAPSVQ